MERTNSGRHLSTESLRALRSRALIRRAACTLALWTCLAPLAAAGPVPISAEFVGRASDPRGSNAGNSTFARLESGKAIAFGGFGRTPIGSNAVGLYDPVADSWQVPVANASWSDVYDVRNRTFLGNRSGHPALVVDGKYWALDGDRGFAPLGNYRGVLDTATWQWQIEDRPDQFFATGAAPLPRINGAAGWIAGADTGYLLGGRYGATASDSLTRVTRNPSGTPPFAITEFSGAAGAPAFAGAERLFAIANQHWTRQGNVHVYGGLHEDRTTGEWTASAALREIDPAVPRMSVIGVNDLPESVRVDGGGVLAYHDAARDMAIVTDGLNVNVYDYASARWHDVPVLTPPDANRQSPTAAADAGAATGPGAWTRYPTSFFNGTEAPRTTWYNLAWDSRRHRAYAISWEARLFTFEPQVGAWRELSRLASVNDFHNRTIAYDALNDRLWVSDGTGSVPSGFRFYDLAAGTWTNLPIAGTPSYEAAMVFDPAGRRLIAFGGWQSLGVKTFNLAPVANAWQSVALAGGPSYNSDAQRMTAWRTVLDTKRGRIVYVDTDGALWSLPLSLSAWQRTVPAGQPPPATTQYVYDAVNDALVGWAGSSSVAGDGTPLRETWLLPLDTPAWRKAASAAAGNSVPPATMYVGYAAVFDPVRQEMLVHTANGTDEYVQQTWSYRHPSRPGGASGGASLAGFYAPEVDQLIILGANARTYGLRLNYAQGATPPGAATNVTATAGNAQATVSFTPPASDGGSPITGYTVTSNPPGGVDADAGSTATTHTITGLTNGVAYTFTVTATNAVGTGAGSASSNSVTPSASLTAPGAPTNVTATAGNAQATVSFTPPASDGGSPITGYTVTSNPPGGVDANAGSTATTHTITGLTNGVAYTFTVRAANAVGAGPASVPSNSVTPAPPATVPGAPTSVTASAGNAQATVSFTPPASDGGSPITGYTVTSNPPGGVDANAGSTTTTHTITGLTNGVAYTFTVRATNAVGAGAASVPSNSVTPTAPITAPGAPTSVTATADNTQATVSFTPPANDGGSPITGYTVTSNPPGGIDANAGSTATTHTMTGLTNGVAYTFTARATNAIGTGPASAPSNSVIPRLPSVFAGPSATGTGTVTVQVSGGGAACGFGAARLVAVSAIAAPPAGVTFSHGLFDFTLRDCASRGTVTLTFTYPSPVAAQARHWGYGPQPPNRPASWYTLGAPNRFAISGNQVTFTITDGRLGDDDLAGNGTIDGAGGIGLGP